LNIGGEEGHIKEDEEDELYRDVNINQGRLRSLEANFSEAMETNQFAGAVSAIPRIVNQYMDQRTNEAVKAVNEQLEAKVLTRSSHSSRTSYAVVADLSEMELKKILIEKMQGNKSIYCSDEQINLYKALVEAYESDKIILDTYRETVTLKRRRNDDADKDEEPSIGPDRGSKRRRECKEPESASALTETATRSKPPSLDRDWNKTVPTVHGSIQPWISELAKQADIRSSFNELMDTTLDFSNFLINRLKVDTLTPELLADYGHIKWIEDLMPRTMWIEEPIGYDKHALSGVSQWGRKRQQFYGFIVNRESALDVYSKRRIIT
nr:hypothetical protein [Tanacetum cinerariifolium]